jgi:hypothetical protein
VVRQQHLSRHPSRLVNDAELQAGPYTHTGRPSRMSGAAHPQCWARTPTGNL